MNNFCAALAFGFRLLGDGALHLFGDVDLLYFDFADFDAPRFGFGVEDNLKLGIYLSRCERISSSSNWPTTLRMVVCASCDVA